MEGDAVLVDDSLRRAKRPQGLLLFQVPEHQRAVLPARKPAAAMRGDRHGTNGAVMRTRHEQSLARFQIQEPQDPRLVRSAAGSGQRVPAVGCDRQIGDRASE